MPWSIHLLASTVGNALRGFVGQLTGDSEQQNHAATAGRHQDDSAKRSRKRPADDDVQQSRKRPAVGSPGDATSNGRNRCVPLIPTPAVCSSTLQDDSIDIRSPLSYQNLANYPEYIGQKASFNRGTKNCIMCGKECLHTKSRNEAPNDAPCLFSRTRGVCTVCSDQVWQVVENKLQVRQCQMCCKWYPWANFQGTKGVVKQCGNCRSEQAKREKKRTQIRKEKGKSPAAEKVDPPAAGKVSPPAAVKASPAAAGKVKPPAARKFSPAAAGKVEPAAAGKVKPPTSGKVEPPTAGRNCCVPLIPKPATCSSTTALDDSTRDSPIALPTLVNFPQYMGLPGRVKEGTKNQQAKNCVMCGEECLFVKAKKDAPNDATRLILTSASGVCTVCKGRVWQIVDSNLQVKRCDRCSKWYPWAHFHGVLGIQYKSCRHCLSRRAKRRSEARKSPAAAVGNKTSMG